MERWIQMNYQIKEREKALELATKRELFYWMAGFYSTAIYGCVSYYRNIRQKAALLPLVPLTFVMGYYADLAYGNKTHRIQGKINIKTNFLHSALELLA